MPLPSDYLDRIDTSRLRRARELSDINARFGVSDTFFSTIDSKSAIVLAYANWEGFYNECIDVYVDFLRSLNLRVRELDWSLLVCSLSPALDTLKDKNHSQSARRDFVNNLQRNIDCSFESFDSSAIRSKSNLDFDRLSISFSILSFDIQPFQRYRIRLDKELVGWRHAVAHGDSPDLSGLDISRHSKFAAQLLVTVSDVFQHAVVQRSP